MTAAARVRFAGVRPKKREALTLQAAKTDEEANKLDETLDALGAFVDLLEGGRRDPADQISEHTLPTVQDDR